MAEIEDIASRRYRAVGRCIYCGNTDSLAREHIIPLGLSGVAILPKASCKPCEQITGKLERKLLRGQLWPVRVLRKLRSRRPYDAPKMFDLILLMEGREKVVKLPIVEYPILLHLPVFPRPGFLTDIKEEGTLTVTGIQLVGFGPSPEEVAKRFGATGIRSTITQQPVEFARAIGKIGLAFAIAELGIDSFEEIYIAPAILGQTNDIGRWVGTEAPVAERKVKVLHHLQLRRSRRGIVSVLITLFSDSQTPSYIAVIGRQKNAIEVSAGSTIAP